MNDFVYTLQRSDGGEPAILRVSDKAITFTIPSSITPSELDAIKGIEALAVALRRGVTVTKPESTAKN